MEHARPPAELCLEGGPANRAESWRKWYKQFCVFLKASGVDKEQPDIKASLLINLIGPEGYDVHSTFKYAKEEDKNSYDIIVKKFNEHFKTKQNTTMARFKFFTRKQDVGESIDEYVTALKLLVRFCEFEHLEEGLVRDRIVCGIRDVTLRDRLLRADDLTLARAVKICQAEEMSVEEQKHIEETKARESGNEGAGIAAVDVMSIPGGWRGNWRGGRRGRGSRGGSGSAAAFGAISSGNAGYVSRGRGHGEQQPWRGRSRQYTCPACAIPSCDGSRCPAKNALCFWCSERGHFKNMCPKLKRRVFQIDTESVSVVSDQDNDDLYYISTIAKSEINKDSRWYEILILSVNGIEEKFKLDTGSDLNVISLNTYIKLGLSLKALKDDNTKALSFCGNYIPIAGSCIIKWIYKSNCYELEFIIANFECQSVLGKYACESLGMLKRIYSLCIDDYSELFYGLGKLPGKYSIVIERDALPSVCPVRKIPIGIRDKLLCELNRMESIGVIRKVYHPTPWVNAIVVAAKKDGSLRVCLDPRPLNRVVRRARYPLPTLTEIATKLEGARFFSKLDARSGFWMVQLDDASADLCTFGTPFGRYQFLRLPYGVNCASEVFHSKVRQCLEDLDGVENFIDDVIVYGETKLQHDDRLKKLLDRARQVGIKFNKEKCEFQVKEITYLGHIFGEQGMSIDSNKIKAIQEMPIPSDRPSLERFLGMVNYLSKFIPHYSEVATPLRSLLKKDNEWVWHEQHDSAVRRLKECVCSAPVLALYSTREPILLSVDSSSHALGAVMLQGGRPVEFASATLTDTQCKYAQIEKELLAIVFALERFHQYVYGRSDVTVESDHKPLEALFKKSLDSTPARLQRMMLRIQRYEFTVVYKPGKYMFVADALSRAPLEEKMSDKVSNEVDEQSCFLLENVRFSNDKMLLIKQHIANDEECQIIIRYIQNGWPNNKYEVDELAREHWSYRDSFEYVNGILFKDKLVYIPRQLRREMMNRVHEGHMGIDRCKRHAREVMYWPGMSRDVEMMVRRCAVCKERAHLPSKEPLIPHAIPKLPWYKVGSDIFQHAGKNFLILVDYFSNFIEVNPLTNTGSKAVISVMRDQFARHGIPHELVTDNGPAYASKEFKEFSNRWGFEHITSSPNYPQSNGRSERSVQTIKNILIKSIASGNDFYLGLLNFRATSREGISSPSELLMGRRLNTRLPIHDSKLRPSRDNLSDYSSIKQKQEISKMYYDRQSKLSIALKPGQRVIVADHGNRKYAKVLSQAEQPRSYFVTDQSGRMYRRNRRHLINVEDTGTSSEPVQVDNWSSPPSTPPAAHLDSESEKPGTSTQNKGNGVKDTALNTSNKAQRPVRPAAMMARKKLNQII